MANTENTSSYAQLMEQVSVTPEMRERVLSGVAQALEEHEGLEVEPQEQTQANTSHKAFTVLPGGRALAVAACLLIALIVGVSFFGKPSVDPEQQEETPSDVAAVNGMVELASREELSSAVGVSVPEVAALDGSASSVTYLSLWGSIAEIRYELPSGRADLRISPAVGDNSGDYNEYTVEESLKVSGESVTLKGGKQGYQLAIWNQGSYGVSLWFEEPVARDAVLTYVASVVDALKG